MRPQVIGRGDIYYCLVLLFLSDYMTHALPHPTSTASILWMAALLFTTRLGICTQEMKRHSPRNYEVVDDNSYTPRTTGHLFI